MPADPQRASSPAPTGRGSQAPSKHLSGRSRHWLRRLLPVPVILAVLAAGPTRIVEDWTGLETPAAVTLLLVVIAASLWITEAIPLFVTSFLLLFLELSWLMPTLEKRGLAGDSATFLAPFFSNVVLLFLGGFVLSTAFRKYFLDRLLARWVLDRTGGEPSAVLGAVIAVTAVLSMWMSNTATSAMMLGLAIPMLAQTDPRDPFRRGLPLGIAFGANLGGLGTPIGTPPNAIVLEALSGSGRAPGFAQWMLMATPLLVVMLVVSWLVLLRMFPPAAERVTLEETGTIEITGNSRIVVGTALVTALLWLTSGVHPLATGTVALVPVIVFFGLRILERSDFQSLPWDVLMLAGGGLSLGAAVECSGLGAAIVAALPVEALGQLGLMAVIALVAGVMTTFMSNTATANLLVPVVGGLSSVPTGPLLVLVAYACSCTMILPVSTPPNAMVFSSGHITTRDLVRPGLLLSGLALLASVLIGPSWWAWIGLR